MNFEQKNKLSIKFLFNQIANNYDKLNTYMSFGLQGLIKRVAVKNAIRKYSFAPEKILDLCTGTGDIALLLKKYCKNAQVIGVDFSENMLKIAKKRNSEIIFLEKDITNIEQDAFLQHNSFDICFISFGLRNLPNIDEFLESIKYYLKDGGILSILDLGKPNFILKPYFYLHYEIFIPLLAFIFNKDAKPYRYFVDSAKYYPSQNEMMLKLAQHGYKNIENKNFSFGIISQQLAEK